MNYIFFSRKAALVMVLSAMLFGACAKSVKQEPGITKEPVAGGDANYISVSPQGMDAAEPAVASDKDGNCLVLYVEHKPDKSADLFLKKIMRDPKQAASSVRINPVEGSVKAWRGDPPTIAVDSSGVVYVGWNLKAAGAAKGNDLVLSVSRDGGNTFAAPVRVNGDTAPASHGMHSMIVGGDGSLYMAWLDERNVKPETEPEHHAPAAAAMMFHHTKEPAEPNSEVFFSVSTDGGKTFSGIKK